jgi:hypothetical protein
MIFVRDNIIEEFVQDPNYKFLKNGEIYKIINNVWVKKQKTLNPNGYYLTSYNGQVLYLHRVIYRAFAGYIDSTKVVNHKNFVKTDNNFSNLENISFSDNNIHAREKLSSSKINLDTAKKIRIEYDEGNVSQEKIGKKYGLCRSSIIKIINNQIWKDRNYYYKSKRPSGVNYKYIPKKIDMNQAILNLLNDKLYEIRPDGTIYTYFPVKGNVLLKEMRLIHFEDSGVYFRMKYKRKLIPVHRVVFAKFSGEKLTI